MEDIYSIKGGAAVPNHVKQFRLATNRSQKELAAAAGITRQTLSLIEKGTYNPSLNLCLTLCYLLDQTLDTVFWVEPPQKEGTLQ